jgi:hypothetical protein
MPEYAPNPVKPRGRIILWIIFGLVLFSGISIGVYFYLRSNGKGDNPANAQPVIDGLGHDEIVTPTDDPSEEETVENEIISVTAPDETVKLVFVHHSTGENWLADDNGGLGAALMANNYFVSDTNYGWGPDGIGDYTDIGNWWQWFRGPNSETYLAALYAETTQNSSYSRMTPEQMPPGENQIIMIKSCFPNSALLGETNDPIPAISSNSLKGEAAGGQYHTLSNAKGIYIDLLEYFGTEPDKLFVVVTAPPLSDPTYAENARAFNLWLVTEWLAEYPYENVVVFDFYNVLTATGNHYRITNGELSYIYDSSDSNTLAYPFAEGDDHPSQEGNLKATTEFVPFLNWAYHRWKGE